MATISAPNPVMLRWVTLAQGGNLDEASKEEFRENVGYKSSSPPLSIVSSTQNVRQNDLPPRTLAARNCPIAVTSSTVNGIISSIGLCSAPDRAYCFF